METKQTIAVFGATGHMGSAISKSLSKGSYRLLLLSQEDKELKGLQSEILSHSQTADAEAMKSPEHSQWKPDIFILAVPHSAEAEIAADIKELAKDKIVVSIANPINKDMSGSVLPPGTSAAEELQKLLPNSKVVKAFNTTFAADFSQPVIDGRQVDCFVAGNDEAAMKTVSELVKTAGFNPIISGDLSVSRTLESMQILLMQLTMKYNYNWLAGWKILH
ncbi:MAG: NAD(P)-binding domain-containing protein [Flavisolibacter sp.]|nr:NAD(P)-binding domain-containing protein [Flavisolibacter sp.]